ncbi:hypothetical protein QWM81_11355 [Streptomyces ficellus]|uniref:TrbL/VirB6 plasmid conjugal transfer protein n=1 Tax=Streptomyces ficellus TaxID=1977088 RepID=A0ABT7Z6C1_9ACTN|nr:hypothetical protein [Streptomyces ficellus]MDN3294641.1 hypothetical protein [Streptomyces ficellus]
MRLRTLAVPAMGALTTVMLLANVAYAADPIPPIGAGGLIPEVTGPPSGAGTLYETYSTDLGVWTLDEDLDTGVTEWKNNARYAQHLINQVLMGIIVLVGRACVVITQWAIKGASIDELTGPIVNAVSGAAGTLVPTVLPACLVIGALVAYGNHRKAQGSQMSQIGWLAAAAIFSLSLLTSPAVWVDGINSVRNIGSDVSFTVANAGIGQPGDTPIKLSHKPEFAGDAKNTVMRKAGDAVWRTYVATPWCVAEFGSLEVCEKAGEGLLNEAKKDGGDRGKWLHHNVHGDPDQNSGTYVGDASVDWRQGMNPSGRMMVLLLGIVAVVIYAVLALMLAFASIASLLGALMLLVAGAVFACLWVIPGRPRQWGVKWFDALLGMVLQSCIATLVLSCVLIITVVCTQTAGRLGWLLSSGLSITAAIVAFKLRRLVETIMGSMSGLSGEAGIAGLATAKAGALAGKAAALGARAPFRAGRKTGDLIGKRMSGRGGGSADGAAEGGTVAGVTTRGGRFRSSPPPPPPGEQLTGRGAGQDLAKGPGQSLGKGPGQDLGKGPGQGAGRDGAQSVGAPGGPGTRGKYGRPEGDKAAGERAAQRRGRTAPPQRQSSSLDAMQDRQRARLDRAERRGGQGGQVPKPRRRAASTSDFNFRRMQPSRRPAPSSTPRTLPVQRGSRAALLQQPAGERRTTGDR